MFRFFMQILILFLLQLQSREGQFFAATTLHLKIMKNWNQVPPDQYENLKNKLLQTIVQYSIGPDLILNRLCIAVRHYYIVFTEFYLIMNSAGTLIRAWLLSVAYILAWKKIIFYTLRYFFYSHKLFYILFTFIIYYCFLFFHHTNFKIIMYQSIHFSLWVSNKKDIADCIQ